jgi:TonB family protein
MAAFRARHPGVLDPGGEVSIPEQLESFQPTFPPTSSKRRRYGGAVIVPVVVSAEGRVADAEPLCQTRNADLIPYVLEAVLRARYKPAVRQGKPVAVFLTVTVLIHVG